MDYGMPDGIRSRQIQTKTGLNMHFLEAGFEAPDRPCVLLLHGFPELAFSWRKVMLPLSNEGFHVVAPDQRGYGRTTGWDDSYDGDLENFAMRSLVADAAALLGALDIKNVAAVIGHNFGSPVAAWCALSQPEVFRAAILMSAPFGGTPSATPSSAGRTDLDDALASLSPSRRHYQHYYGLRAADQNMRHAPDGIAAFLRAYYHMKSADWPGNDPHPLADGSAAALAELPEYYVMQRDLGMAETVAAEMPTKAQISACSWLADAELQVYADEFSRTGFQGGLQWYRAGGNAAGAAWTRSFAGKEIEVPSLFIAGRQDWGVFQSYGAFERMQTSGCSDMRGCHLIDGAGHWVQQEKPDQVVRHILEFIEEASA